MICKCQEPITSLHYHYITESKCINISLSQLITGEEMDKKVKRYAAVQPKKVVKRNTDKEDTTDEKVKREVEEIDRITKLMKRYIPD